MLTPPSPTNELFRDNLSRLLASEQDAETIASMITELIDRYCSQAPDEAPIFYTTAARDLEAHSRFQPICLAAISLVKFDRDAKYTQGLSLTLQEVVRASPSTKTSRGAYQIILAALEAPSLRHAALQACEILLSDPSPSGAPRELREFAKELLALFRRVRFEDPLKERVKSLGHVVFTLGRSLAPQPSRALSSPSPPVENPDANHEASRVLLHLIMQRPALSTLDRLTTDDFKRIGELSGLTLDEFKITVETLSQYAARDGGALDAFLRVAKSEHGPMVSAQTRTQALASFLATWRRRGGLSHEVERQILATSAQIPELPFVGMPSPETAEEQTD